MENLRYLLKDYDSKEPHYIGCQFDLAKNNQSYNSGGAGEYSQKFMIIKILQMGFNHILSYKATC
jgi:hypothetical protein